MKPVAVIPMNDPDGIFHPHLKTITPLLKQLFSQVFISEPISTQKRFLEYMNWLESESFFTVIRHETAVTVEEDFITLYTLAASVCAPEQVLHLCFIDRVAFALQSEHCGAFTADIQNLNPSETPLIFQRSELAWQTHPRNYRELEQMVTTAGEYLFGKSLDFAWCHLAVRADQLLEIMPAIEGDKIGFIAKFVLALRDEIHTKAVDWLAWEDPFITKSDPQILKHAREASMAETQKRLGYVIPMLQMLLEASNS